MMLRLVIVLFLSSEAYGQFLENPSFEGSPQAGIPPSSWKGCNQYSTPDTQPGFWEINVPASHGQTYISLFTRGARGNYDDGYTEAVGTPLKIPFDPGRCYVFSMDLAFFRDAKFYDSWGDIFTYENPVILKVWAASAECGKDVLLYESVPVAHAQWQSYTFPIHPENQLTYLILEANFATPQISFGSVLVDNIRIESPNIDLGPDQVICEGTSVPLKAIAEGGDIEWSTGSTESTITVNESGVYSIRLAKQGCVVFDTISFKYTEPIDLELGKDTTLCQGDTLWLNAEVPQANYRWSTGASTPRLAVTNEGNYHVTVDNGCYKAEDEIYVLRTPQCCTLEAPNVFTPNGDTVNDYFEISSPFNLSEFHLTVYNRWGKIVYESTKIDDFWNGDLSDNRKAATGVYFWTSTISCRTNSRVLDQTLRGSFTLLR